MAEARRRGSTGAVAMMLPLMMTPAALAGPVREWRFDTGREGWSVVTLPSDDPDADPVPYEADWFSSGGNPDGYISELDPDNQSFYFSIADLGDVSEAYGAALRFDLRINADNTEFDTDILLTGGGLTIYRGINDPPAGAWTSYGIVLQEAGWLKSDGGPVTPGEFQTVLSALDAVRIRGEYFAGDNDRGNLDNVIICEPQTLLGDIDGDGEVGLGDLSILLANFGTVDGAEPEDGDLNGDGAVDLSDLSILLAEFGTTCG